jgi:exonuclease SbcC
MEPIRLEMKDFLSYHGEIVDFSQISCAALTGDNGSGKSSILEGVTFALFGQGSKAGRRELDLFVRKGAEEARVALEFRLDGQTWRVLRTRHKTKNRSILELARKQEDGTWALAGGRGIDETQSAIEGLLRMDYGTFTSSSLVLQGRSNTFTAAMTDAERKETLARILGLDIWPRMEDRAKKAILEEKTRLQGEETERTRLRGVADLAEQAQATLESLQSSILDRKSDLGALEIQETELNQKMGMRQALGKKVEELREEFSRVQARGKAHKEQCDKLSVEGEKGRERIAALDGVLLREKEIPGLEAVIADLETQEAVLNHKMGIRSTLEQSLKTRKANRARLKEQIEEGHRRKARLEKEHEDWQRGVQELDKILARKEEIRSAAVEKARLETEAQEMERTQTNLMQLQRDLLDAERAESEARKKGDILRMQLETKIESASRQAKLLDLVPCGEDLKSECPLLKMAREARASVETLRKDLEACTVPDSLQARVVGVRGAIEGLSYDPSTHERLRTQIASLRPIAELQNRLVGAESERGSAVRRIEAIVAELDEVKTKLDLDNADLLQMERDIQDEERELQKTDLLGKETSDLHARLAERKKTLADLLSSLASARTERKGLAARLVEIESQVAELNGFLALERKEAQEILARGTEAKKDFEKTADIPGKLAELKAEQARLDQVLAGLQSEAGRCRQTLESAAAAREKITAMESDMDKIRKDLVQWELFKAACSNRGGVPTLILEGAIPELERIANEMLDRMAQGRLQVRLDLQAETKTGKNAQEVLRITVLQGGLDRPYQTYSGAEQFLVDLALRVAVSKFLTHRAGAEIRFFVLDEGLGACDEATRMAVLDAIKVVSAEFGKTLVITHIAELQDSLPQRIEVRRTASGSKVTVQA